VLALCATARTAPVSTYSSAKKSSRGRFSGSAGLVSNHLLTDSPATLFKSPVFVLGSVASRDLWLCHSTTRNDQVCCCVLHDAERCLFSVLPRCFNVALGRIAASPRLHSGLYSINASCQAYGLHQINPAHFLPVLLRVLSYGPGFDYSGLLSSTCLAPMWFIIDLGLPNRQATVAPRMKSMFTVNIGSPRVCAADAPSVCIVLF